MPRSRLPSGFGRRAGQRREQAEIDVHRLERARPGLDGLDMAAGDVAEQRPSAVVGGRRLERLPERSPRRKARPSGRCADFPHSPRSRSSGRRSAAAAWPQPQLPVEQLRRVQEGVAVQAAEPGEFGVLEARDGAEDPLLRAVFSLVWKPTML